MARSLKNNSSKYQPELDEMFELAMEDAGSGENVYYPELALDLPDPGATPRNGATVPTEKQLEYLKSLPFFRHIDSPVPSPETRRLVTSPKNRVFEIVVGCRYKVLTSVKIAAATPEEAAQIAQRVVAESRIEGPDREIPPAWIDSMASTVLTEATVISARPESRADLFSLKGIDIKPFIGADKPE